MACESNKDDWEHLCNPPSHFGNFQEKNEWKLQKIENFSKSKGHNSAENCSICNQNEPDLDIIMINL